MGILTDFTARGQLRQMCWVRIGFGLSVVAAPRLLARATLGSAATSGATGYAMRMWGVREAALGAITLRELAGDGPSRELVGLNAAVDAVDALATALAGRTVPWARKAPILVGALVAVGASARLLRELEEGAA